MIPDPRLAFSYLAGKSGCVIWAAARTGALLMLLSFPLLVLGFIVQNEAASCFVMWGATSHLPSRKLNLGNWSALRLPGPVAALMLAVAVPGPRVRGHSPQPG